MNPAIDTSDPVLILSLAILGQAVRDIYSDATSHMVKPAIEDQATAQEFLDAASIDQATASRILGVLREQALRTGIAGRYSGRKPKNRPDWAVPTPGIFWDKVGGRFEVNIPTWVDGRKHRKAAFKGTPEGLQQAIVVHATYQADPRAKTGPKSRREHRNDTVLV